MNVFRAQNQSFNVSLNLFITFFRVVPDAGIRKSSKRLFWSFKENFCDTQNWENQ